MEVLSSQVSRLDVAGSKDNIVSFRELSQEALRGTREGGRRFDETRFLDRYLGLYHLMNMESTLKKLVSVDINPVRKSDILALLCHFETLTCPSSLDLRDMRDNIIRIEPSRVSNGTFFALTKLLFFLQHPLIEGFIAHFTSLSGDKIDDTEWPKTRSLEKIGVPPGHLRDLVIHDLKSRLLTPSVVYRLSVFKPYVRCEKAVELIEKTLGSHTPPDPLIRINHSFRNLLFPQS